MIKCHCDICGIETFINPPTEQVMTDAEYQTLDPLGNPITQKRTIKVPEMTHMRVTDPNTGKVVNHPIPKLKDLKPRMWRVQLRIGQESIDRDFCKECLDNHLKADLAHLRDILENIERK